MAELPLPEKGQQISEHSDPPKASPGLPEPPPPAAPENAARSACGNGSMDDDGHVLRCVACNIARWNECRRDERLRRSPKRWPRRLLNRAMRLVVLGDPLLLPPHGEKVGYVE